MASSFVSNPSFCFIAPTSYLTQEDRSWTLSNTHLVLAHLVAEDPTYASFYLDRRQQGDFIMMDNSAYELKVPFAPSQLIDLAHKCGAHAIVLPDYPFQPGSKTVDAALKHLPEIKEAGFLSFFVPQSTTGDLKDWIKTYRWAAQNPDIDIIGMSILGIPNALPAISPSFARVVMSQILTDRGIFNPNKHHHFLGLNAGPALEIPSLLSMGVLDTVDSSNPVWMAILGHQYNTNCDSYLPVTKVNLPVDFHSKLSRDAATHTRIKHNVDLTHRLMLNNKNSNVWYAQE